MSILTDRAERAAAIERLAEQPVEALERELAWWALASHKSGLRFRELVEQEQAIRELHAEEETWVSLIADELVKRRSSVS